MAKFEGVPTPHDDPSGAIADESRANPRDASELSARDGLEAVSF
jgi:hypothetical protein